MNYKKKKHLKQQVYLEKIVFKSAFFIILQSKFTNVHQWSLLQKQLGSLNTKIWTCPIYLLKKKGFFPIPEYNEYLNRSYSGNIVIIHSTSNVSSNEQGMFLKELTKYLKSIKYLIPLYILYLNRVLEIDFVDKFLQTIEKNIKMEIIYLLAKTPKPVQIMQNYPNFLLKKLS